MISQLVSVPADRVTLSGDLVVPPEERATALCAHGLDSSRRDPGSRAVAAGLNAAGYATLSLDLLSEHEERAVREQGGDRAGGQAGDLGFDVRLLGRRAVAGVDWLKIQPGIRSRPVILFGAGAGAAAVLEAAAELPDQVLTAVVWGGRPDRAGDALRRLRVPVLLVTGDRDPDLLGLTEHAGRQLTVPCAVRVVPGEGALLAEPGARDRATDLTRQWCEERLRLAGEAARGG
ncbi:dienelactone hydrolase family protein [Streptomyces sp. NPDC047000]|uniref:dienelactone hydrolase family protein n=1 Tax=Streptomyces sp. NPDC047000 TaxID=3155474 RepID=UPI00340EFECB